MAGKDEADEVVNLEDLDDEFDEKLPCTCRYVMVCVVLSGVNGLFNAFLWPAYTIHFTEYGWSLVNAGLAITLGFVLRGTTQQLQLLAGYWLMVPLAAIHLVFAILALIYWDREWAVFAQIVTSMGIDSTCSIEGICFDTFGTTENLARQAASTCLSVFTFCSALSCTFGGMAYDLGGWQGVSLYHTAFVGLYFLILVFEPACKKSFRAVFFPNPEEKTEKAEAAPDTTTEPEISFVKVVPAPKEATSANAESGLLPGAVEELKVEDVEESDVKPGETPHGKKTVGLC